MSCAISIDFGSSSGVSIARLSGLENIGDVAVPRLEAGGYGSYAGSAGESSPKINRL
jgi:hypothetical protein